MIKLIKYDGGEIGNLLYDKHVPRQGDYIKFEDNTYHVEMVTFDDDDGVIKILVRPFLSEVIAPISAADITSNNATYGILCATDKPFNYEKL